MIVQVLNDLFWPSDEDNKGHEEHEDEDDDDSSYYPIPYEGHYTSPFRSNALQDCQRDDDEDCSWTDTRSSRRSSTERHGPQEDYSCPVQQRPMLDEKQKVRYLQKTTGEWFEAVVVGEHFEGGVDRPYYTITVRQGNGVVEKQKNHDQLIRAPTIESEPNRNWSILCAELKKVFN